MQLPFNSFQGYGALKTSIYLGRYLRQCNLALWGDYPLQHSSVTVLQLRFSPTAMLHRRHLTQVCVGQRLSDCGVRLLGGGIITLREARESIEKSKT
ncbi:hypothetical protein TNCV_3773681 [Trichonephila clavipes]|nr:hypothetical protein TNCV_3773681 [Trichonephila clavipes]